ncbi:type II toxin-antitoxin system RelE/ParE family toxin [Mesohalobacter halotolerans]|jgi:plasmid stabilization system protein ParE|uniref:Type II toxin-antitoxin system RelE/ParE family toxin n=1 Tax=Mesohalobacter halotolerans TaxID=1883405 RepID=A0A4U5TT25_9FLAO|nr:type II toxin-antitoxin system RelE/ParE family toxin [Mesohalobacter halotolerans]MBS3738203.1 type II toxin-antitoxin system RelE/ParE family toxin [Psychroflexus sp.]NBC58432.1 type II toxin-antitoxin system RelE/ParE family toxin [Bacteroidota bacterium]TKS57500.1 hypothetical protein FCN74_03525 [Mesohalobacter halotolerans]
MVRINWTFQSKNDLKEIAEYISKDSKLYAKRQILTIRNRTHILKTQSYTGRIVSKNRIDILTIHHSARNLKQRNIE